MFCRFFQKCSSFLLVTRAESNHTCKKKLSFRIAFFKKCALCHFIDDQEFCDITVSLITVQVRAFVYLRTFLLDIEVLLFEINTSPDEIEPFSDVELGEAIGHPMHGHLQGLLVRAGRLLLAFQSRLFDQAQRLLQHILQESLHSKQQHNFVLGRMLDPGFVLGQDQFHKSCRYATCGERKERSVVANFF